MADIQDAAEQANALQFILKNQFGLIYFRKKTNNTLKI